MGTNYYHEKAAPPGTPRCAECGALLTCESCDGPTRVHIGKSSAGWTFSFHATDTIRSYADWIAALEAGGRIVDEYGREISLADFRGMVEGKQGASHNHAREYPDARSFLDPAGHSFSTGEFS